MQTRLFISKTAGAQLSVGDVVTNQNFGPSTGTWTVNSVGKVYVKTVANGDGDAAKGTELTDFLDNNQLVRVVSSRRKTAEVQWIEVTAPSTYRAYLPVRGGKYHLAAGLPQWPVSACNEEDLDTSTMQLISAKSPARASKFCPKCAKIIAQMEAER